MAVQISGTTVIDDSRNLTNAGTGYFSGDITSEGTGATQISAGTTAQRPGSPQGGMLRLNSTTGNVEVYTTSWQTLGTSGGNISGNAATATQIYINESSDPDTWWNIPFYDSGSSNANHDLYGDDGAFTFNPSQNIFRVLSGSTYVAMGNDRFYWNYGGSDSEGTMVATTLTGDRTWTLPNKSGTVAMTSDITAGNVGTATSTAAGVVELFSDTTQSTAANAVTSTASRTYGIQLNSAGQMVVNVPWSDTNTNTTYTADETTLTLSGTEFQIKDDGVGQDQLASVVSLIIYDSGGTALKTLYGAGA